MNADAADQRAEHAAQPPARSRSRAASRQGQAAGCIAAIASSNSVGGNPAALADAQLAQQRDVRRRPAEPDAADPAPLPHDLRQRRLCRRCPVRHQARAYANSRPARDRRPQPPPASPARVPPLAISLHAGARQGDPLSRPYGSSLPECFSTSDLDQLGDDQERALRSELVAACDSRRPRPSQPSSYSASSSPRSLRARARDREVASSALVALRRTPVRSKRRVRAGCRAFRSSRTSPRSWA